MTNLVHISLLDHARDLPMPTYASAEASGMDLRAAIPETVLIAPGQRKMIPTGISMALAPGTEGQIRGRSGLAANHGVTVLNSPGTIDSDYRGELCAILINHGENFFVVERGDRVAQLVISPVLRATVIACEDGLPETERGVNGLGSSGVR